MYFQIFSSSSSDTMNHLFKPCRYSSFQRSQSRWASIMAACAFLFLTAVVELIFGFQSVCWLCMGSSDWSGYYKKQVNSKADVESILAQAFHRPPRLPGCQPNGLCEASATSSYTATQHRHWLYPSCLIACCICVVRSQERTQPRD